MQELIESVKMSAAVKEGDRSIEEGSKFLQKRRCIGGQVLETILTYFNKVPFVCQLKKKKNLYFESLFSGISMYFPVLQSPQKHSQIKITNYYFRPLSSAQSINIGSATHVPHAHTFAVISRLAPHCTAPFGAVQCGTDLCVLECVPGFKIK